MIRVLRGNLFESDAEALVNTVNCVGVMGKGIAYQFKKSYPRMFGEYQRQCRRGEIRLGEVTSYFEGGRIIVNFPTKDHWRAKSTLDAVSKGLDALAIFIAEKRIRSIAIPPLGCGNGGLDWADVFPIITTKLEGLDGVHVEVFEPAGSFQTKAKVAPRLSLGHFVLVALRTRLLNPNKLHIQKAAFFFNVFAGSEYFRFVRHKFGPYNVAIDAMSRSIREYLDATGLESSDLIELGVSNLLAGNAADRLKEFLPVADRTAEFCNKHSRQIEELATAFAVVAMSEPVKKEDAVCKFLSWSKEKAARFDSDDALGAFRILEDEGFICSTLLGLCVADSFRFSGDLRRIFTEEESSDASDCKASRATDAFHH